MRNLGFWKYPTLVKTAGFYQQVFAGLADNFFLLVQKIGVEALKNKLQGTARFQMYSGCSVTNDELANCLSKRAFVPVVRTAEHHLEPKSWSGVLIGA